MKGFADFCSYLERKIEEEPERFPVALKSYSIQSLTTENIQAFIQDYSKTVIAMSNQMAMCYLQIYHEWLSEQLS